jgi:hypothetical protein
MQHLQNPPTVMAYHRPMCSAGASQGRQAEGEPGIGAKLIEGREDDAAA